MTQLVTTPPVRQPVRRTRPLLALAKADGTAAAHRPAR